MRSIEFASDEPSVPPQDGVRQSGSGHLAERLAAESVADFAKRRSLAVGKYQASLQLAVFLRPTGGKFRLLSNLIYLLCRSPKSQKTASSRS
jgi:hypothetical protein